MPETHIKVGDAVLVRCVVKSVAKNGLDCAVETVVAMQPGNRTTEISLNIKQLELESERETFREPLSSRPPHA